MGWRLVGEAKWTSEMLVLGIEIGGRASFGEAVTLLRD
jgi:hypothetical protein